MKRLFLVCLTLLLCMSCVAVLAEGTECTHENREWRYCDANTCREYCIDCETPTTELWPHIVFCSAPDVCVNCGTTEFVGMNINHPGSSETTYINQGTSHKIDLSCCDLEDWEELHYSTCDSADTSVCDRCGAPVTESDIRHSGVTEGFDETHDWSECTACGTILREKYVHYDSCRNPGVCDTCFQTNVILAYTAHSGGTVWTTSETHHTQNCGRCNAVLVDTSEHVVYCTDTDKCVACGAEGIQGTVRHNSESSIWSDETGHWNGCIDCGEPFGDKSKHEVPCAALDDGCYICGYKGEAEVFHPVAEDAPVEYDEYSHWWTCICGESKIEEPHYALCTSDACMTCGYAGSYLDVVHEWGERTYIDEQYCGAVCTLCGEESTAEHVSWSCLSNICEWCGEEFENNDPNHSWTDGTMEYDASGHWFTCVECGETAAKADHWYFCEDPNTCMTCGYVSPTATNYSHYWTEVYQKDNPDYHYKHCVSCGGEYDITSHTVSCANPGVCTGCGATGITVDKINHGDVIWEHNDTKHWGVCQTCGGTQDEGPHWTDCSKPNLCQDCGATGVTIDPSILSHFDVDWNNYEHDATHHWYTCRTCNIKAFYEEHAVNCNSEGTCTDCGYVGDFDVQHPALKAGWAADENNHWKICAVCGDAVNKAAHSDDDENDECDVCKQALAHTHKWGEPVTVEATCTADGSTTTTCRTCGEKTVETIKATGHAWSEPVIVEATCTADGSKTTTCANCDEKTVETIKATGHAWGEPVIVAATCTKDGSKTTSCANCTEKTVETIKATGHAWGEPVIVEATCTEDGSKTTICSNCNETTVEMIPSLGGHKFKVTENVAATCTTEGRIRETCMVCYRFIITEPAATGHAWGEPVTVDATCTEAGSVTITCANCGEKTVETIEAIGHAWGEPVTVEATCTEAGSVTTTCSACGEETVEPIEAKGHAYDLVYKT